MNPSNLRLQPKCSGLPKNVPGSPTDHILSPTSKALRKKMPTREVARNLAPFGFSIESTIASTLPQPCPLILGTSSQNRIRIAKACGWDFEIQFPNINEKAIRCSDPLELPLLIAQAKANKLMSAIRDKSESRVLITADQICLYKEQIREKPMDENEAYNMLASYSNDSVTTVCALVATHVPSGRQASAVDIGSVTFGEISSEVISRVVGRGRIMQSAGAFCIEDEDLHPLITHIEGGAACVMGFPVDSAARIIEQVLHAY